MSNVRSFSTPNAFRSFVDDCVAVHCGAQVQVKAEEWSGIGRCRKGWKLFRVQYWSRKGGVVYVNYSFCRVKQ